MHPTTTITAEPIDDGRDLPDLYRLPHEWYLPEVAGDVDPDLTIVHDHENGTVLDGDTRKGDGVLEILTNHRFQWRRNVGIYIPQSRDKFADLRSITAAAEALRAAGWKVAVEVDDVWRVAADREGARAERVSARVGRLTERAVRRFREGDARHKAARDLSNSMPFGEPIKIGHHSEGRHRRAFEKIEANHQRAYAAWEYAEHLAARAGGAAANEAAKHNPRAIMRRIETMQADRRRFLRHLEDAERGEAVGQMRRCSLEIEKLDEDIHYQRAKLGDMAATGRFVAWGPDDFAKGDEANIEGRWCQVARINVKGVSVRQRWDWHGEDDKPQPVTWDQIFGRRRDGMQWDKPNADPWPVDDAVKVAKWRRLVRDANSQRSSHSRDDEALYRRIRVDFAIRIVLGLSLKATDQEVEAYGEPADQLGQRARALALYAVYERLEAGEKPADVAATVEPIADTVPAWTMPVGEPEDVRGDRLMAGDIICGVYDSFAGNRRLVTSIVGPVTSPPVVEDRREAGDWVIVHVNGDRIESRLSRWFSVHRATARPPVEAPAEPVVEAQAVVVQPVDLGAELGVGTVVSPSADNVTVWQPEPEGEPLVEVDPDAEREAVDRALLAEAGNRLNDARTAIAHPGPEVPVQVFAGLAATASWQEVVRMANRLRVAVLEQQRLTVVPEPARPPVYELGEVWEAPVRSWTWQGVTRHTVAVSVDALYLESYRPGYLCVPYDMFGWQVVARGDTPGEQPVWAVFWQTTNTAGRRSWRQVTGELTGRDMQSWDGIVTLQAHERITVPKDMIPWLDGLVADLPDPFPGVQLTDGTMPAEPPVVEGDDWWSDLLPPADAMSVSSVSTVAE